MGIFHKLKKAFTNKDENEKGNIDSYDKGLQKTRKEFVSKLNVLTMKYNKIDSSYFDELEEILIMADMGIDTVMHFIDALKKRVKHENITNASTLREIIVDEMFILYVDGDILSSKIKYAEKGPTVFLFVGVNGAGKTTTIGKLAYQLKKEGKKVLLVAADTFRAGAVAQICKWGDFVSADVFSLENADPSSVIYDALQKAKRDSYDVVLVDTAGRLQNKVGLMKELEKMNKVIGKLVKDGPHETLLVMDASAGQNGIHQARQFREITDITGIVLTKLDGTAKGGIVFSIKSDLGIPVKYIGLGEKKEDLQVFDIEKYIYGLFKEW